MSNEELDAIIDWCRNKVQREKQMRHMNTKKFEGYVDAMHARSYELFAQIEGGQTMTKEAQIVEIAKILDSLCHDIPDEICHTYSCSECKAIQLYEAGYRNRSENVVEWISIEERVPEKPGNYIVAVDRDGEISTSTGFFVDKFRGPVTHWMPLPEPPDMKGGE